MISVAPVAPLLRPFGAMAALSAPGLSVVDHGDNSGATATLAAALGSAATVYVGSFAGELGTSGWTAAGSLAGGGSLTLSLPPGHYLAYARSSLGGNSAASLVTYFVVTDGNESLHARCLAAVQARIRLLGLAGLPGANVIVRKLPLDRNLSGDALPAIILSPHRAAMPEASGTNGLDDVFYDVLVTILDRDNQDPSLELNLDRHLLWRQQIARSVRNQRLSGVPQVINAEVEPAEGMLEQAWQRELLASALLVRFTSRETRGI